MKTTVSIQAVRQPLRTLLIIGLDTTAAAFSLVAAIDLRVGAPRTSIVLAEAPWAVSVFAATAAATFYLFGLHRRIWRFASLGDLLAIAQAVTVSILAFSLILLATGSIGWMPRSIPVIQWLLLVMLLGAMRMARRMGGEFMSGSVKPPQPTKSTRRGSRNALVLGPGDDVDVLLRRLEADSQSGFRPVGIIGDLGIHRQTRIRGVPILGAYGELARVVERLEAEGRRPECLVFAGSVDRMRGAAMANIVSGAQLLGLEVAYSSGFTAYGDDADRAPDFRFINVADLLGRPQSTLDATPVGAAIAGRCVMVTGAGGTIGRELVRQVAGFRPGKLILLDANEFNLYEVDLEMRENYPDVPRAPVLCSIRQRQQLMRVFDLHRPELVFHAAALKHVPLVEGHLSAGIQTNVLGTRNVADAAQRYGARAMIQVSTDKAVNPVGFMGMTKRLGELYAQALDLNGAGDPAAPRFMTVRFGNVLGSSGSLIPLFQRQLGRGGPLTVTHPDIERFFMTVHEAVQLVLHSAACGLDARAERGRIFVLDMGKPVRIIDIARRMIRLAGFEPEVDVAIEITGLRPGEKLYEELFDAIETRQPASIPGVFEAEPKAVPLAQLDQAFQLLEAASAAGDDRTCRAIADDVLRQREDEPIVAIEIAANDRPVHELILSQAG
ncbi:polysaccharide biosynthesis protein [Sphingomonas sp. SUN019]|uniref:nucleoside-diphosphate sugar epimerase/dehydratase n=1 Tax=Sphingomonas sp. SUN019 TaxID=2937788 RepID=UPI00216467A1|nr:nucleoside-diphosphate sugar epimerase/dehydratase [Sphingomonas sp. SUN019]UVO51684.1 polysaccharide biosynthesis protein [Sphingomonas sp. SUN019]